MRVLWFILRRPLALIPIILWTENNTFINVQNTLRMKKKKKLNGIITHLYSSNEQKKKKPFLHFFLL